MSHALLYLNQADVAEIALPMEETIEAVELALVEKAHGRTHMPPKHWIATSEKRFYSAMSSAVEAVATVACKWQSGSSLNADWGLPYLTGLLIINDLETGLPVAVMDSTWITAERTAAASAVAARYLARDGARVLGMIGCGLQGRTHVRALRAVLPGLDTVRAYDIVPDAVERYAVEIEEQHGVAVVRTASPHDAVTGADIVVTGGPIEPNTERVIDSGWVAPGALGIAIDYDCYWKPAALHAADGFFTDDVGQIEHLREYGYFLDTPPIRAEIGEVAAGLKPGRSSRDEVLITYNLGVSVEDVTTARRVYDAANARGVGTRLPL